MCAVPLPPGFYPIAVDKYVISYFKGQRVNEQDLIWVVVLTGTFRIVT